MCANSPLLSLLLITLAGGAFSASIKGGNNGTKGRWDPPKDWDWSVTPGRLIPVSEATDDLPTPGYRMSQLQQRIPANQDQQPFPIMNMAVDNTTTEDKVVVIGQKQTTSDISESKVTNDLSTTHRLETTDHFEESTPKEMKPHSGLDEQELILLHDEPIVYQREHVSYESSSTTEKPEKIPVVEETMEKVELPEICSISGIGCRDPKPVPQKPEVETTPEVEEHTEVLKHPKVVPHPHVPHPEVQTTEQVASSTEQSTSPSSAVYQTSTEEYTSKHDQLPSDSHHIDSHQIDHQVVQQVLPYSPSSETTSDESLTNKTSENNSTLETVTLFVPHFNLTAPTVVHSVVKSFSEHIGYSNNPKHEANSTLMNNATDALPTDSQHTVDDEQVQLHQQEQQVQQQQVYSSAQLPQEAQVHQVEEQKLLEIANSWGSSDNSTTRVAENRMDEPVKVVIPKDKKNSEESPSLGDRLESYWKAATVYVSKALNL